MTKEQKRKLQIIQDFCKPMNKGEIQELLQKVRQIELDQFARKIIFKGE